MEAVEATAIGHERGPFGLEGLPDGPVPELWMGVDLGVGNAVIEQDRVQFLEAPRPQPRCEEPLPHQADLVLGLPPLSP